MRFCILFLEWFVVCSYFPKSFRLVNAQRLRQPSSCAKDSLLPMNPQWLAWVRARRRRLVIDAAPATNQPSRVRFTAGSSSRKTAMSNPPPRYAVAMARWRSATGWRSAACKSPRARAAVPNQRIRVRKIAGCWAAMVRSARRTWALMAMVNKIP